jgi:hypothetical protein
LRGFHFSGNGVYQDLAKLRLDFVCSFGGNLD